MIDAGSSGSRIHVYRFNYCKKTPEIEDEVFHQLQPGLSSNIDDPEKAAASLDKLMDVALSSVPKDQHHCTPVAVKATAGLRLHREKSDAVLEAVKRRLTKKYPFPLVPEDPVSIMDGKDEGNFYHEGVLIRLRCFCLDYGQLSPRKARSFCQGIYLGRHY